MNGWPVPFLTLVQDEDGTVRAPIQSEIENLAIMLTGTHHKIYQQPLLWAGLTFTALDGPPYGWKVTWAKQQGKK